MNKSRKNTAVLCGIAFGLSLNISTVMAVESPVYKKPDPRLHKPNTETVLDNVGNKAIHTGYEKPVERELKQSRLGNNLQMDARTSSRSAQNLYKKPQSRQFSSNGSMLSSRADDHGFHKPSERASGQIVSQRSDASSLNKSYKKPSVRKLEQPVLANRTSQIIPAVRYTRRKDSPQF